MFRTTPTPRDAIAVVAVLLVAVLLLWNPLGDKGRGEVLAVTTPQGSTQYSLSENREIFVTSRGVTLCIVIESGEAYVLHSDCPDRVCVRGGKLSKSGQTVLCAPAGVMLAVKGGRDGVDFVAG